MKKKYVELEEQEDDNNFSVPDWQVELGIKERELIAQGKAGLMDWNVARKKSGLNNFFQYYHICERIARYTTSGRLGRRT